MLGGLMVGSDRSHQSSVAPRVEGEMQRSTDRLAYGAYSISEAGTNLIKNDKVRVFVSVYDDEVGHWDFEKVKLTYRYAFLQ